MQYLALKESRVLRVWGGLEAETKDAMPIMGTNTSK